MCIIVAKPTNVAMPTEETLRTCFTANSDGAGLMYVNEGKVVIKKGFMSYKGFNDYLKALGEKIDLTESALVMHFRISTQGLVDGGNCHPYPITNDEKALRALSFTSDIGMVHNGVIRPYSTYKAGSVLNDTQLFIKECVTTFYEYDSNFYENQNVMAILEKVAGSKLCFLDTKQELHMVGDFINDGGVFYSNNSYVPYKYTGGYKYTKGSYKGNKFSTCGYAGTTRAYGASTNKDSGFKSFNDVYYGRDEEYYDYEEDSYDVQSDTYVSVDDIISKKVEKSLALTKSEFEILCDRLTFVEVGKVIKANYGEIKVEQKDVCRYATDDFSNLYSVDWINRDIIQLDVLVTVVD